MTRTLGHALALVLVAVSLWPVPAHARQAAAGDAEETMSIEEYEPHSTLRVPETPLTRARFPRSPLR